jgi:hypothetical protein
MHKLRILGMLFLSVTILFSCGDDVKSDKDKKKDKLKKEIKDPCDILDYSIKIFEDLDDLADNYDDIDDLEDDRKDKKKVDNYFDDLEDAWKYAFKEFDNEEMQVVFGDCDNDDEFTESLEEVEYFFEQRCEELFDFISEKRGSMQEESYDSEIETVEERAEASSEEVIEGDGYYDGYNNGEDDYSPYDVEEFMRLCTSGESDMYDYCECVIDELMYVYTTYELENMEEDEVIEFIQFDTDCLELINYDEY